MNFQNPYFTPFQQPSSVIKVNGENGARALSIGANSSALLLDESGLMVWLVTTDGAGYKTVNAYDITPHQIAPSPDLGSLEERIKKLEEIVDGYTANSTAARRRSEFDHGDGETGKGHAWRESTGRDNGDR